MIRPSKLGTYKTGNTYLYVIKLSDITIDVLKDLVRSSFDHLTTKHPS